MNYWFKFITWKESRDFHYEVFACTLYDNITLHEVYDLDVAKRYVNLLEKYCANMNSNSEVKGEDSELRKKAEILHEFAHLEEFDTKELEQELALAILGV